MCTKTPVNNWLKRFILLACKLLTTDHLKPILFERAHCEKNNYFLFTLLISILFQNLYFNLYRFTKLFSFSNASSKTSLKKPRKLTFWWNRVLRRSQYFLTRRFLGKLPVLLVHCFRQKRLSRNSNPKLLSEKEERMWNSTSWPVWIKGQINMYNWSV